MYLYVLDKESWSSESEKFSPCDNLSDSTWPDKVTETLKPLLVSLSWKKVIYNVIKICRESLIFYVQSKYLETRGKAANII